MDITSLQPLQRLMTGHFEIWLKIVVGLSHPPLENDQPDFKLEDLSIRDIEENECLAEIVATGLCQTDPGVASRPDSVFPRVLGHEGKLIHA